MLRVGLVLFALLPENKTSRGRVFMNLRGPQVAWLARYLARWKRVSVDRALTLLRVPA
jgi:hypothetical protein